MEVELFRFQNKEIRARAIKRYMEKAGYEMAVCFSCGNASKALREIGVDVVDVSPSGDMEALRWFKPHEIATIFPTAFDATSGHLPFECMLDVSKEFKSELKELPGGVIYLPTGSGETLVCLKLAFPQARIVAVYNLDAATQYDKDAQLNGLVELLAEDIIV